MRLVLLAIGVFGVRVIVLKKLPAKFVSIQRRFIWVLPVAACLALPACANNKPEAEGFSRAITISPLDDEARASLANPASDPGVTGSVAGAPRVVEPLEEGRARKGQRYTLDEAVFSAVHTNPRVGIASARARQAGANINIARAGHAPQVDAQVGFGFDGRNDVQGNWRQHTSRTESHNSMAAAKVTMRALIFDFGSTRANIARAERLYAAELFRRFGRAEEIAARTIEAYLRVHEQTQLLNLGRENLRALNEIAQLVKANEAGGNATAADVSRVETTLSDARKMLLDQEADLESALDAFRRLTQLEANDLAQPRSLHTRIPASIHEAERIALEHNPELLALRMTSEALANEVKWVEAGNLPRIEVEVEGGTDLRGGVNPRQEGNFRAMVYMRQNLYDGGARAGQINQIKARLEENGMQYADAQDEVTYDLRRLYRAMQSARDKQRDLTGAVNSASEVQRLYREQFRAGRRTLFEILDAQNAYYSARRDQINNTHESLRAEYDILRTSGKLLVTMFPD